MSVVRINEFHSKFGCEEELLYFLNSLKEYIVKSAGCESCEVFQHNDDMRRFILFEKWDRKESHHKSIVDYPKKNVMAANELFASPPKGDFYSIATLPK